MWHFHSNDCRMHTTKIWLVCSKWEYNGRFFDTALSSKNSKLDAFFLLSALHFWVTPHTHTHNRESFYGCGNVVAVSSAMLMVIQFWRYDRCGRFFRFAFGLSKIALFFWEPLRIFRVFYWFFVRFPHGMICEFRAFAETNNLRIYWQNLRTKDEMSLAYLSHFRDEYRSSFKAFLVNRIYLACINPSDHGQYSISWFESSFWFVAVVKVWQPINRM